MGKLSLMLMNVFAVYGCGGTVSYETNDMPWIHAGDFDKNSNLHRMQIAL